MRTTIIRSTIVVDSGIRQIRGTKAGWDCAYALAAARQFLARLNQSLNALVERMGSHSGHPFSAWSSTGERSPSQAMAMWFGMTPVAVALPKVVAKPSTPSGRVS
jgi:hypothetical protein